MTGEKQQKARINSQPQTPSKPQIPERPVVGSSSTWRKEQLVRFLVEQSVLEVNKMIPDKWFEFGQLENYQSGKQAFQKRLTIVRDQITSVQPNEIKSNRVILQKAPNFTHTFWNLQHIRGLNVTDTRLDNFAEKRHEKRSYGRPASAVLPVWVGPSLAPLTPEEAHRIVSISDPSKSSAGSRLFTATQEHESESLATSFCQNVLKMLFLDDPSVVWSTGRDDGKPMLEWRNRYFTDTILLLECLTMVVLLRRSLK
jgi:hypothetical protein